VISVSRNNRKGEEEEGGGGSYRGRVREGERSIMAVLQDVLDFIPRYTGLTPVTFFTVVALVMGIYYLITSMLAPPPAPVKRSVVLPLPPPVQLGEVTLEELAAYNGSDPQKPLLMAIKAQIYDVSQSRAFYGPGGPYALFAGKDASRALAKMSFEDSDLTGDIEGLSPYELEALTDWEYKFMSKYVKVGVIKPSAPDSVDREAPAAEFEPVKSEAPVESDAPIESETEKVVEAEPTAESHPTA
jgi:membrane-associated progesterone receptor component